MVLKTLETMGPLHGYGIARRIEQTSGDVLVAELRHALPRAAEARTGGRIASEWGVSENNRQAKFYRLTRAGRKQLEQEAREWEQATAILGAVPAPREEPPEAIAARTRSARALLGTSARRRADSGRTGKPLAMHIDDNIRAGMTPEAARRDALLHRRRRGRRRALSRSARPAALDTLRQDSLRAAHAAQESRLHRRRWS